MTERENGKHKVKQIVDNKTKLEVRFGIGKADRIITGDETGRQVKLYFNLATGKLTSVENHLNGVWSIYKNGNRVGEVKRP